MGSTMSRDEVLIVRQSGENMVNSAIFPAKSGVATHFRHFYGLQTQIDTLRISGRSLDAYETRAVAPSPFRVLPDLWGTNHQLLDGPPRRTCAKKNSEMESLRQ
jgi:hypothetical protein